MKVIQKDIDTKRFVLADDLYKTRKNEFENLAFFVSWCIAQLIKTGEFRGKTYILKADYDDAVISKSETVIAFDSIDIAIDTLKKVDDLKTLPKTNGNGYNEALIEQTRKDLLNEAKKAWAKEQWIKLPHTQQMIKDFTQRLNRIKDDKIFKLESIKEKTLDEAIKDKDKTEDQIIEIVHYKTYADILEYLTADTEKRIIELAEYEAKLKAQAPMFYKSTKFVTIDEIRKEVRKEVAFDEVKKIFETNDKLIAEVEKGE